MRISNQIPFLKFQNCLALLLLLTFQGVTAQTIDDAALVAYFKITDNLRQGNKLDSLTWQSFLNIEGNRLYLKNQNAGDKYWQRYRKYMEIVYRPQNDSLLQVQLQNPEKYWLTYMINQYKKHEPALRQHQQAIMANKARYLDSAYHHCHEWLPAKLRKRTNDCQFYLTALNNDAVAEESAIILTIWSAYHFDKEAYGALAGHELHHVLRKPRQYKLHPADTAIMQVLELIISVGVPDLMDKKLTMRPGFPDELKFGEFMLESGRQTLAQLDTLLMGLAVNQRTITLDDINTFAPMSGHIPGFYMTDIMLRNGFKKEIINSAQNPFRFFNTYYKAAQQDSQQSYILSDKSIKYLKMLEKRNPLLKK
ncbi:MAG: hypothetical protein IT269_09090 [Saprospiraceae bacterium]|nr:hypothetical protein [Saprospiraceae bacterium]